MAALEMMVSGTVLANVIYFSTGLASVGWNRFQNIYFLSKGIPPSQIGELKSIGLALKFVGNRSGALLPHDGPASVDAIFNQSPKHLGTSCMATLNLFYQALGFGIGSLLWGYMYEYLSGMNTTFYFFAIAASCTATTHFYCQGTSTWLWYRGAATMTKH
jgi:hypothetical protein